MNDHAMLICMFVSNSFLVGCMFGDLIGRMLIRYIDRKSFRKRINALIDKHADIIKRLNSVPQAQTNSSSD